MKVFNKIHIPLNKISKSFKKLENLQNIIATGTGIDIRSKKTPENVIKENLPSDPIVAKKIIDSLSLGFINFKQGERDTLANILMDKVNSLKIK
jgi:hypothetical protein